MRIIGRFRDLSTLFLIASVFSTCVPAGGYASDLAPDAASRPVARSEPGWNAPIDLQTTLVNAMRQGQLALVAQAYDSTYRNPWLRDEVVGRVSRMAPAALRDVTTAADLGVLTAGQPMRLAPNAMQLLAARAASNGPGASAIQYVPMAVNTVPDVPAKKPSDADQTWNLRMIGAQTAYDRKFTGKGVNVAVADTGFDTTHAALGGNLRTDLGRNYMINGPGLTYDPTLLDAFSGDDIHGSHVAGIVAAKKLTGVAAHGVAYDAMVIPLRVLSPDPDSTITAAPGVGDPTVAALTYFASLSNSVSMVYNASYGPSPPKGSKDLKIWTVNTPTTELQSTLDALKAGKIIVAANGNDRMDNPVAGKNPSGLPLFPYLDPAHANTGVYDDLGAQLSGIALQHQAGQIIGVMALSSDKTAAPYSNLCGVAASWCVAAPGGNTLNNGLGIYSTVPYNTYAYEQGTSMAAPMVSGALAVLIQANPSYNASDLSRLLFSTTEDLGKPGIDDVFGYGLIRLDRATDTPIGGVAANANIAVAADTTAYWSQLLTTQGDFTKSGEGILTIAGRTNAGGNVFAALGTLAVDGTLTMSAGNRLNVAQPATLAGFGTINGDTVIAGTLSPGKMANIGDLVASNSVAAGTVLSGNSVGSLTFNGNVTLTSTASTRIDIDGVRNVQGGPGTYDVIYVSGAGNVFYAAGALTPVLRGSVGTVSNYTPALGAEFDFVQAQNGARTAGSFATLVQPTSGLAANSRLDVRYAPEAITLRVMPASFAQLLPTPTATTSVTPAPAAVMPNPPSTAERAVAAILDNERAPAGVMPSAAEKALFDALYNLDSEAKLDKALEQLGGPGQPAISSAPMQAFTGFLGAVGDRQDALGLGAEQGQNGTAQSFALSYAGRNVMSAETASANNAFASVMPTQPVDSGWSVWGQGFGRSSRVGDSGELSGSKAVSGGFTVGADRRFANSLIAGGAFGYARTTATSTDMRGTSDTYAGAAYASWTPGAAVVDFRIAAGPSQISTTRQMILTTSALSGSTNGVGVGTSLEAGYRFALAPNVLLKPFAGINWQGFRRDGYSESNLPFGLVYAAQTYDKLTTTAGIAISGRVRVFDGATLMPELKIGWGHDLRDTTLVSTAALLDEAFTVEAARPGRDAALVGLKMSGWRSENFRLFAAYNGEFRSNAESHQLSAGARFSW